MELLVFNRLNTEGIKGSADRKITVASYNGVRFSKKLLRDLKLTFGDRVLFFRDKDNIRKWYMSIADKDDVTAFEIQESTNSSAANGSRGLSRTILACFNDIKVLRFLLPKEPETVEGKKYYVLIPIEEPIKEIKRRKSRGGGKA